MAASRLPLTNLINQMSNAPLPAPENNPVTVNDVSNRIMYCNKLRKRKHEDDNCVTNQELVNAEIHTQSVLNEFAGGLVAPAWFHPTMTALLQLQTMFENRWATVDDDEITPPTTNLPPPVNFHLFPRTVRELRTLQANALMNSIETYYGLPHAGGIEIRKKRLFKKYGMKPAVV